MSTAKPPGGAGDLLQEARRWKHTEDLDAELRRRVSSALDEVRDFLGEGRLDLARRRSKVLQTPGFKDETSAREAALAGIEKLLAEGRNISRIFADIDRYLRKHKIDDTLSRSHTRAQLADARDEFMCRFHDSIRGTRLAELLDVLHFMPFAFWHSRGLERRNFRSPSAGEVVGLLEELTRRRIEFDRFDTVQLAAVVRLQLGITPRMDFQGMSGNKLAELLTDGETLTRFTSRVLPPDEGFCRTAGRMLANLRQWAALCFADAGLRVPAEIEAEMLQIAFLAGDRIRLEESGTEGAADYLWLLATVVASAHATLKEALTWPDARNPRFASVHERMLGAKTDLDRIAVLADGVLATRWAAAGEELVALTDRADALCARDAHGLGEFKELEGLKDLRSDVGKAMIKLSDALQLLEPALLDVLATAGQPSGLPAVDEHVRRLSPSGLIDRNRAHAEETRRVTRQELDRLRALIERIATISRRGFATPAAGEDRARVQGPPVRRTSGGADVGSLPPGEVRALLAGSLGRTVLSLQDSRNRIEGVRRRLARSALLPALNVLHDRLRKAAEAGELILAEAGDAPPAPAAAQTVAAMLRECLTAQAGLSARVGGAKLTPAEKPLLTSALQAVRARLGDDLRDLECLGAEFAARCGKDPDGPAGT